MGNFSIWRGDIKIIPVDSEGKELLNEENFNTCVHRSDTQKTKTRKLCCGSFSSVKGYICAKRGIFDVKSDVCATCPSDAKKKESST